ncbi:MAG: exosortase-associated EpsI family protein [Planctomycetota bacterium]
MNKRVVFLVAVAVLVVAGAIERKIRQARSRSAPVAEGVRRLNDVPMQFGAWIGRDIPMDPVILRVAECAGHRNREYVNSVNGRTVELGIMVGLPGPMAEHTPEACYPALGYTLVKKSFQKIPAATFLGKGHAGELARMEFVNPNQQRALCVWHAWFDGQEWLRPDYSRLSLTNRSVLFRLQVAGFQVPDPFSDDGSKSIDPAEEFLKDALPELTAIFSRKGDSNNPPEEPQANQASRPDE